MRKVLEWYCYWLKILFRTASFLCNIKWAQKALCGNYRFTELKKKTFLQKTDGVHWSKLWSYLKKRMVKYEVDGAIITTYITQVTVYNVGGISATPCIRSEAEQIQKVWWQYNIRGLIELFLATSSSCLHFMYMWERM